MAWLVAVRFDHEGMTIIRPWRRRRIAWTQVSGLVWDGGRPPCPGRPTPSGGAAANAAPSWPYKHGHGLSR
jgi:hypothetical protein